MIGQTASELRDIAKFTNKHGVEFELQKEYLDDDFVVTVTRSSLGLVGFKYKINNEYHIEFQDIWQVTDGIQPIDVFLLRNDESIANACLEKDEIHTFYDNIEAAIIEYGKFHGRMTDEVEKALNTLNHKYNCTLELTYKDYI